MALDFETDLESLSAPAKNLYLVRVKSGNEQTRAMTHSPSATRSPGQQVLFPETIETRVYPWENQWLSPAPLVKAAVKPFPVDELRLQRIKRNSQAHHGVWEIDAFYTPAPVEGNDRPFFPYTFLCADRDSGFILGTVLAEPSTWENGVSRLSLDSVEEQKLLPGRLSVRKEELRELFEPLAAQLGIEVTSTKKLSAVDGARRELLKFMSRQR